MTEQERAILAMDLNMRIVIMGYIPPLGLLFMAEEELRSIEKAIIERETDISLEEEK